MLRGSSDVKTGVPIVEDPMELSLDIERRQTNEEDIDIDLDLTGDQTLDAEDDYMGDDLNPSMDQASPDDYLVLGGRDDEMLDDDNYSLGETGDHSSVQDEDLEDATYSIPQKTDSLPPENSLVRHVEDSFDDPGNILQIQTISDSIFLDHVQPSPGSDHSETIEKSEEEMLVNAASYLPVSPRSNDIEPQQLTHHFESADNATPSQTNSTEILALTTAGVQTNETPWDKTTPKNEGESFIRSSDLDERAAPKNDFTLEETTSATSARTHPVIVVYLGSEMSLFPPLDQDQEHPQTYLLDDESLAGESIRKLFGACRIVLAGSVAEEDELEIKIATMGLHVSESTSECSTTTLGEILDLYVQLKQQDGIDNPGPLYLTLSTRANFSARMDHLFRAATEGKGLSFLTPSESDEQEGQDLEVGFDHRGVRDEDIDASNWISGLEPDEDFLHNAPQICQIPPGVPHSNNLTSDRKQYEVNDQTDSPPLKNNLNTDKEGQAEESQAANGSLDASDGLSNVVQTTKQSTGSLGPDIDALSTTNNNQSTTEERDFIYYEEEAELNHGSSERSSSTVQAEINESQFDSSNSSIKGSTSPTKDANVIIRHKSVGNDLASSPDGQVLVSTLLSNPDIEGVVDVADADGEKRQSTQMADGEVGFESEYLDNLEISYSKNDGHIYNFDASKTQGSVQENQSSTVKEEKLDNGPAGLQEIDNNQTSEKIQLDFELESAKIITHDSTNGHACTTKDESIVQTSQRNQNASYALQRKMEAEANATKSKSTTQPVQPIRNYLEELTDTDEITYEDDGNDFEPAQAYHSEQKQDLSPGTLKRTRNHHDDSYAAGSSLQTYAKRLRSE